MPIKDQDLPKKHDLATKILIQAIESANESISIFKKRSTIAMLISCEETLLELIPMVEIVANENPRYRGKLIRFKKTLEAVQLGSDVELICPAL